MTRFGMFTAALAGGLLLASSVSAQTVGDTGQPGASPGSGTRLQNMTPEQRQAFDQHRQKMRERLQNMTPEQRQAFEQRRQKMRERFQNMTPEQKQQFRQRREAMRKKWQSMTPEQQRQFREKLRNATPEQRRQMWQQFKSSDTGGSGIRWNSPARPANVAGRS
jgi:hypothetical protein